MKNTSKVKVLLAELDAVPTVLLLLCSNIQDVCTLYTLHEETRNFYLKPQLNFKFRSLEIYCFSL